MMKSSFPFYHQRSSNDCGPTCLKMISKFHGKEFSLQAIIEKSFARRQGVSILELADAGEALGLRSTLAIVNYQSLKEEVSLPAIIQWRRDHFVVVTAIDRKDTVRIADPAFGMLTVSKKEFLESWAPAIDEDNVEEPIVFFTPTPEFFEQPTVAPTSKRKMFSTLGHYLLPYKTYILQVVLSLFTGSLLLLAMPFLTQSIMDIGIANQNLQFVYIILAAQLILFVGRISGEIIRNWILLHVGLRINITMVSDFLVKLTKLPISFFDSRQAGDFFQRIVDHDRIETFLTKSVTTALFSIFTLFIFLGVLLWFSSVAFIIFLVSSMLYLAWILLFLKRRKHVDYRRFEVSSRNSNQLITLIRGMQEIKMNGAEKEHRWKWERTQAKLFKLSALGLQIDQYQQIGSLVINETKNILITSFSALSVISGNMTLGEMLAIQYIIGQLNAPILDLVNFIRSTQDAAISLERLSDVNKMNDEEPDPSLKIQTLPVNASINICDLSFRYGGPRTDLVLQDIDVVIPAGKVTALIGASGSGKTTLMKLILKFYDPTSGRIQLDATSINDCSVGAWRKACAVVMQDGFIFADSIARNIAVTDAAVDKEKLIWAAKIANVYDFIQSLPLGFNTRIGSDGVGLSGGQNQRILIARAVYKDPKFIFFDEATSSLDTENERIIMENLNTFFKGKTVVVIAHRLSTVRNADKIIVLNKGRKVEEGMHAQLVQARGEYYSLVKNQLELGT